MGQALESQVAVAKRHRSGWTRILVNPRIAEVVEKGGEEGLKALRLIIAHEVAHLKQYERYGFVKLHPTFRELDADKAAEKLTGVSRLLKS